MGRGNKKIGLFHHNFPNKSTSMHVELSAYFPLCCFFCLAACHSFKPSNEELSEIYIPGRFPISMVRSYTSQKWFTCPLSPVSKTCQSETSSVSSLPLPLSQSFFLFLSLSFSFFLTYHGTIPFHSFIPTHIAVQASRHQCHCTQV